MYRVKINSPLFRRTSSQKIIFKMAVSKERGVSFLFVPVLVLWKVNGSRFSKIKTLKFPIRQVTLGTAGGKRTMCTNLKRSEYTAWSRVVMIKSSTTMVWPHVQCWYRTMHPTLSSLSKHFPFAFVTSHISTASEGTRDSPSVGLFVTVVQRLEALLFLLLAEACGVGHFEEGRWKLHQPARVDGGHLPHVLLGGQHQLVVHNPEDERGNRSEGYFYIWKLTIIKRTFVSCLIAKSWTEVLSYHSGWRLNRALEGWMYTTCWSIRVR